ncbi:putative lysozyme from lambdoid prophage DLP12 domain protein [Burkholderia pseudomallei]|nr:putative lysozyme from lambdoid prophage DLP12 domain protein [Burkholderia pseudomallei]KGD20258.1 putative lysozyme from lambdoid prophage DLP12 domain protein [Burkholderia pseudomallei]
MEERCIRGPCRPPCGVRGSRFNGAGREASKAGYALHRRRMQLSAWEGHGGRTGCSRPRCYCPPFLRRTNGVHVVCVQPRGGQFPIKHDAPEVERGRSRRRMPRATPLEQRDDQREEDCSSGPSEAPGQGTGSVSERVVTVDSGSYLLSTRSTRSSSASIFLRRSRIAAERVACCNSRTSVCAVSTCNFATRKSMSSIASPCQQVTSL